MNKVRKSRVEHVEELYEENPKDKHLKNEHLFIEEVCATHLEEEDHGEEEEELGTRPMPSLHEWIKKISRAILNFQGDWLFLYFPIHTKNVTT